MKYFIGLSSVSLAAILGFFFLRPQSPSKVAMPIPAVEESFSPDGEGEHGEKVLYEFNRIKNPMTGEVPKHIQERALLFSSRLPKKDESSRSLSWLGRGPINFGGRTRAFATDVLNENIVIAGSVTGGIHRSTDGGLTFSPMLTPLQLHSTTCVAQDTRTGKSNTWYCGTGEFYGVVSAASFSNLFSGNGIYKSTDNGLHWNLLPSTVSNTPSTHLTYGDFDAVWDIVCDNHDATNDVVLAAVYGGVFRSADGGASWTAVLGLDTTGGASEYVDLMQTPSGVFYAALSSGGLDKGIWRSTDGINWTNIMPSSFAGTYDGIQMAYAPSDETKIYVIANTPGSGTNNHQLWYYHYVSGSGAGAGGTWQNRSANIPMEHCLGYFSFDFGIFNSQSSYNMCIAVKPDNPDFVLLCGTNIYRSTDGFTSLNHDWIGGYQCDTMDPSNYTYPNHHSDQHVIFFSASNPNKVYSANDGGIYYTNDINAMPMTWVSMNHNYLSTQFYTIAVQPGNTSSDVVIGGLQDNGTFYTNSIDPFSIWKHIFNGDGAYCSITHVGDIYYLSIQQGKVYKCAVSSDGTVTSFTRIDPRTGSDYQFINPFILDPTNDEIMYVAGGKYIWRNDSLSSIPLLNDIYNSITKGWKKLIGTGTGLGFGSPQYTALAMSESNNNKLYIGTDAGQVCVIDSAKSSSGTRRIISDATMPLGYVSSIAVDKYDANALLVSYSNYGIKSIFSSQDGGGSWSDVSGNLEQNPDGTGDGPSVMWVHCYHDEDTTIYFAGTSTGLYATSQLNGLSTVWTQEGSSTIGNVPVNMITSRTHDGMIAVGTHGKGVFTTRLKSTLSIDEAINTQNVFLKAYPNPLIDYAVINFAVPTEVHATITIYNMGGQEIRQLYDKTASQGTNSIVWDAKNDRGVSVGTGHYLAVIKIGTMTKSVLLVKH